MKTGYRLDRAVVALFVVLGCSQVCEAWGREGHRLVASVAEMRLSDQAKEGVKDLLGNVPLADIASWADEVRSQRRETGPWHYVDIPVEAAGFDAVRDGKNGDNVIDRTIAFERILANPAATKQNRADALKFVVHLVGDMHQPLHCAERNKDKGGNARLVFFLDEPRARNLHQVWDTSLLLQAMGNTQLSVFASALNARISAAQVQEWSKGNAEDWANESHRVAAEHTYAGVPVDGPPPKLGRDYVGKNVPIVEEQIEKGGVRLAILLNRAFAAAAANQASAAAVRILAIGDQGRYSTEEKNVAHSMAKLARTADASFDAALVLGDNFYIPLESVYDREFQDLFETAYDPGALAMPFYTVLGNHDYRGENAAIELEYARVHPESRWKMPAKWYRVELPASHPLVTLFMLDSNKPLMGEAQWQEQLQWLDRELAKPRTTTWTICCAHHTMFSNGAHADNGVLMTQWGALFRKYGVDFYFCGHDHTLQHLQLPNWPISFVISGGGGGHTKPMLRDNRGPFSRSTAGFVAASFTPGLASVQYYDENGVLLHSFQREKSGAIHIVSTTSSDPATKKPLKVIQGFDEDPKTPGGAGSNN